MKTIFIFISIVLFYTCTAFAQQDALYNKDDSLIHKMLNNQVTEWNKGNIDGYMKGYWESDSLIFIGKTGPRYGYAATLQRYKTAYPTADHMGKLSLIISSIKKLSDDYYFVVGKWGIQRKIGNIDGYYSLLIKRINGDLVIIVDHSS